MEKQLIIGPFSQILTMSHLPSRGPINDNQLEIIHKGSLLIQDSHIKKIITADELPSYRKDHKGYEFVEMPKQSVVLPGFIDSHTHICFAGSRADDYGRRLAGETYLEIAQQGGGILSTVRNTRNATEEELSALLCERAKKLFQKGITTCEVKSGYGLSSVSELKMLRAIKSVAHQPNLPDLISTCLSAHVKPPEFTIHQEYLQFILDEILPKVKKEHLSDRIDIFIEEEAFSHEMSLFFLQKAKLLGFDLTVHADQFTSGGTEIAVKAGALSADHLEAISSKGIEALRHSNTIATVLPGASLGLGIPFAPARKIIDSNIALSISSDWNPGSAPHGDLLMQAAFLGVYEKLTLAETLAGITTRAARALNISNRGEIREGFRADLVIFSVDDYREILYTQGNISPHSVIKAGIITDVS